MSDLLRRDGRDLAEQVAERGAVGGAADQLVERRRGEPVPGAGDAGGDVSRRGTEREPHEPAAVPDRLAECVPLPSRRSCRGAVEEALGVLCEVCDQPGVALLGE